MQTSTGRRKSKSLIILHLFPSSPSPIIPRPLSASEETLIICNNNFHVGKLAWLNPFPLLLHKPYLSTLLTSHPESDLSGVPEKGVTQKYILWHGRKARKYERMGPWKIRLSTDRCVNWSYLWIDSSLPGHAGEKRAGREIPWNEAQGSVQFCHRLGTLSTFLHLSGFQCCLDLYSSLNSADLWQTSMGERKKKE